MAAASLSLDELEIDLEQHCVRRAGEPVDLTVTEFNILSVLAREAGKVVDKNRLAQQSLQRSLTLYDRSLDMHLSNLRKKLGLNQSGEQRIRTVRGVGYMYTPDEAASQV